MTEGVGPWLRVMKWNWMIMDLLNIGICYSNHEYAFQNCCLLRSLQFEASCLQLKWIIVRPLLHISWNIESLPRAKLRTFAKEHDFDSHQAIVRSSLTRKHRSELIQVKIGILLPKYETDHFQEIAPERLLCKLCTLTVPEDEIHFYPSVMHFPPPERNFCKSLVTIILNLVMIMCQLWFSLLTHICVTRPQCVHYDYFKWSSVHNWFKIFELNVEYCWFTP